MSFVTKKFCILNAIKSSPCHQFLLSFGASNHKINDKDFIIILNQSSRKSIITHSSSGCGEALLRCSNKDKCRDLTADKILYSLLNSKLNDCVCPENERLKKVNFKNNKCTISHGGNIYLIGFQTNALFLAKL